MAFFTEDEIIQFKEHGFIGKPGVVDRMLLDKAADRFYEAMGVDRNDPKTFINAGPPSQNLKAGLDPDVRATLSESPIQEMCEELVGHELAVQNHTFAKVGRIYSLAWNPPSRARVFRDPLAPRRPESLPRRERQLCGVARTCREPRSARIDGVLAQHVDA